MNSGEDRNLLFGVLAMQLRGVPPVQLAKCASAWSADRSRGLPAYLIEAGLLSPADCEFLNRLVDGAIDAHSGDAEATLADFGGAECIERTFQGRVRFPGTDDSTIERAATGMRLGELDASFRAVDETPGRYTGVSEHARGGMGRVLLVYDEHLGREVAMKELLPFAPDEEETLTPRRQVMAVVSRFLLEARITGQLEHPSIVPVYELGRHKDGSLYYTMKLVRGRTLSDALRSTASLSERLALLPHYLDLCQAIAYAHSRGIIHRDVKPSNVMIGEFGETVVLDWGLAKSLNDKPDRPDDLAKTLSALKLSPSVETAHTSHGQVLGTPAYMPPEQARGELENIDERSDVYSLGAVLYELLTGSRPYSRGKAHEILQHVIAEAPPRVTKVERDAPQELVAVCERAMARNQRDRYSNAKELVDDIERFQTGALVSVYRYSLGEYLRRWVRRHKAVAATAAAAAALILLISTIYVISLRHTNALLAQSREEERNQRIVAEEARNRAEEQNYVSSIRLAFEYLNSRAFAQAGEVLWNAPESYRNWEWGYLLSRSREHVFSLPDCSIARYSPDGLRLTTASRGGEISVWDASTGTPILTIDDPAPDRLTAMRVSPDGSLVATGGLSGVVKVWRAETGEPVSALGTRTGAVTDIQFSPDSRRLMLLASDGNGELWDLGTGSMIRVFEGRDATVQTAKFSSDGFLIVTTHVEDAPERSAHTAGTVSVWSENSSDPVLSVAGRLPRFRPGTHDMLVLVRENVAYTLDADTGQESGFRIEHGVPIRSYHYNPDGSLLLVIGTNDAPVVYRAEDGSVVATLDHGQPVRDALFSPDSSLAVTFTDAGSFKVWLLPAGTEIGGFSGHSSYVAEAEFSPDNTHFVSMGLDHEVHVWNARTPLSARTVADIADPIVSVSVAGPVRRIALGSSNGYTHVLDYETSSGVAAFGSFAEPPIPRQTMSPDGKLLCMTNDTMTPLIWNIDERTVAMHTTESHGIIGKLAFSPDSKQLAVGYSEGTVCVVDVSWVREDTILDGHTAEITALAFHPDSVRLVTASSAGEVVVWDTRTGSRVIDLPANVSAITALAVAPDGSQIITAASDNAISVWDTTTGEGGPLATSPMRVASLTYLSDTNRVVTHTASPGGIRILDPSSGQVLLSLSNEGRGVSGLHHDPGLASLIVAGSDGVLRELRAAPWDMADSPVSASGSWLERFSAYREETLSTTQIRVPYTQPSDVAVAVPRNVLAGFLDTVGDARRAAATERPPDASVVSESVAELLAPLGIRAGDRFENLNGVSFAADGIDDALEQSQQGVRHGDLSAIGLRLTRNAHPVTFTYHALDIVRRKERIEMTAAALLEVIEQQRSIFSANRASILRVNADRRRQLSQLARDDSQGSGFWVVSSPSPDARKALSELGLQTGDHIMSMDGEPMNSIEDVESSLSRMLERIRSNEFESTQLVIMRGAFLLVELTVVMS